MNAYSLLIDLGGTDLKVASSSMGQVNEESIFRVRQPNLNLSPNGQFFINHEEIMQQVRNVISKFIQSFGRPENIFVTGQMGSWIITDEFGAALTEIISWQSTFDNSLDENHLTRIFGESYDNVQKKLIGNGGENWAGAPWRGVPSKILEIKPLKKILFHTLTSWVTWELTGRMNHVIHLTDAAATGLVRIPEMEWITLNQEYLSHLQMPKILPYIEKIGYLIGTTIPVFCAIGDQQASVLGAGLDQRTVIVNAGTGGQVVKLQKKYLPTTNKIRPFLQGNFIETVTHIPSGRFISKFLDELNSNYNTNFGWEWIWQAETISELDPAQRIIEWNFETFLHNYFDDKLNPINARDIFLKNIVQNFLGAITTLNLTGKTEIILAGGVAQKWGQLRSEIQNEFNVSVISSKSTETTLEGLGLLQTKNDSPT